jgi:hypothetical protein
VEANAVEPEMRVVEEGKLPENGQRRLYRGRCSTCKALAECLPQDISSWASNAQNTGFVNCPTRGCPRVIQVQEVPGDDPIFHPSATGPASLWG